MLELHFSPSAAYTSPINFDAPSRTVSARLIGGAVEFSENIVTNAMTFDLTTSGEVSALEFQLHRDVSIGSIAIPSVVDGFSTLRMSGVEMSGITGQHILDPHQRVLQIACATDRLADAEAYRLTRSVVMVASPTRIEHVFLSDVPEALIAFVLRHRH